MPDHGEAALIVQLRGRQVREQPVPAHRHASRRVRPPLRHSREQHVPVNGDPPPRRGLRGRTGVEHEVQPEVRTTKSGVTKLLQFSDKFRSVK